VFYVEWVNITGFTISANAQSAGAIMVVYANHVSICDNILRPVLPYYQPSYGIYLDTCFDTVISQNVIEHNGGGIQLDGSDGNTITENTLHLNIWGMVLSNSYGNAIYQNNFINNNCYPTDNGVNQWDNGYEYGGNYWDDFDTPQEGAYDEYNGEYQNITGADYIVDLGPPFGGLNPYTHIVGGGGNKDWYPYIVPSAWEIL